MGRGDVFRTAAGGRVRIGELFAAGGTLPSPACGRGAGGEEKVGRRSVARMQSAAEVARRTICPATAAGSPDAIREKCAACSPDLSGQRGNRARPPRYRHRLRQGQSSPLPLAGEVPEERVCPLLDGRGAT